MELIPALILAGAANALLLATVTALAARGEQRAAWLSATFAVLATSISAIFLSHETEGSVKAVAISIETLAALTTGPIIYHFIRASLSLQTRLQPVLLHFVPAFAALIAFPWLSAGHIDPPSTGLVCLYQGVYTTLGIYTFLKFRFGNDRSANRLWWPVAVLGTMVGIHAAQVVRFVSGPQLVNVVPILAATSAFGLLLIMLLVDRVRQRASPARYARSSLDEASAKAIYNQLLAPLKRDRLYCRPDLSLAELAAAAGVSTHHASQAISASGKTTFHDLVASFRVAEATRLLTAPENARVAIEPIGMEAGFRSRSTFYATFRLATGMTPAEYRRQLS